VSAAAIVPVAATVCRIVPVVTAVARYVTAAEAALDGRRNIAQAPAPTASTATPASGAATFHRGLCRFRRTAGPSETSRPVTVSLDTGQTITEPAVRAL